MKQKAIPYMLALKAFAEENGLIFFTWSNMQYVRNLYESLNPNPNCLCTSSNSTPAGPGTAQQKTASLIK
jgi:hypothetical protein